MGKISAPCVLMLNKIEDGRRARAKKHFARYIACDAFLAGIVRLPDMAKAVISWHADVELSGHKTRGQVVLDHLLSNKPNVNLINDFDSEMFKEVLVNAVYTIQGDYFLRSKMLILATICIRPNIIEFIFLI